jgi:hypothetical protein
MVIDYCFAKRKSNLLVEGQIQRTARRLRAGVIAVMAVFAAIYAVGRLGLGIPGIIVVHQAHGVGGVAAGLAADLTVFLLLVALVRLVQMLTLVGKGELFTPAVVRRFRAFAFWLLLMALCSLLAPTVLPALGQGSGPHRVLLALQLNDLIMVGVTLLLFLLAHLLERARAIDEEMREFV